jgi:Domain of unknown function (DUF1707)
MAAPTDSDATTPPPRPRMRASDTDRLATVRALQDAVELGLLTPDECSDRMADAFAAVHRDELGPLTADLPAPAPAPSAAGPPGWRPLGTMAVAQLRSSLNAPGTDRLHPTRLVVAVLAAVLLLVVVGSIVGELLFDGGGRDGFDGFDRDVDRFDDD